MLGRVVMFGVVVLAAACVQPAPGAMGDEALRVVVDGGDEACTTLYAGQHIDVGEVCMSATDDDLLVTYETTGGWGLLDAHLWSGEARADAPTTGSGNPIPGRFPYHSGDIGGDTSYTFTIPIDGWIADPEECDDVPLFIAAHAVVQHPDDGEETAWGFGPRFVEQGNWATWFQVTLSCEDGGGTFECRRTYAWHDLSANCFVDDGFSEVGYTNGPLALGRPFDMVAPGPDCDPTAGGAVAVGRVFATVGGLDSNPTWTITIRTDSDLGNAPADALVFDDTYVYLGADPYPLDASGAQTIDHADFTSAHTGLSGATFDQHVLTGQNPPAYLIIEVEVCGDYSFGTPL